MRFSKYNHEGYHDPTVYEAFTGIEKERKQEKQAVKQLRASIANPMVCLWRAIRDPALSWAQPTATAASCGTSRATGASGLCAYRAAASCTRGI